MCLALSVAASGLAAEAKNRRTLKFDASQEYYVYLPKDLDPSRTYWLFVAVHGLNGGGKGALGWARFADEGQCIVVGPTFKGTFQFPSKGAGEKMKAILRELSREYRFHRKVFLTGFSAGAQFSHRFALSNPAYVVGCAPHSAGSWSSPHPRARMVPFLVTCGTADKKRIEIAKRFASQLKQKRYKVQTAWFEGVGHSFCKEARELTKEFYWTVTTGLSPEQRQQLEAHLGKAKGLIGEEKYSEASRLLTRVAGTKKGSGFAERAMAAIRQIENIGKEKLAEIDERSKTDVDGAVAALEKIQEQFKGMRVALAAARRLRTLKSKSKVASTPKEGTDEKKPKVKSPPKSASDRRSKAEKDCRRWMMMAKNYIANRRTDKARQYLEKIITTYPDSEHAKKAQEMLRGL